MFEAGKPFTSDIAFNTQPGHIPFRAKLIAREDRAFESLAKARNMGARAEGIRAAAEHAIYSDDPDAIERLTERIAELEAQRETIKAENAAFRKAHREELKGLTPYGRDQALPHAGYELTNLSGNISRQRARLEQLRRDAARARRLAASFEAEPNALCVIEDSPGGYVSITFPEKPAREVLEALKAAGFSWSRGSWWGKADAVPEKVRQPWG